MAAKKSSPPGVIEAANRASSDLAALGVGHALVGGLAVSVRADPRFTRDVDLALAVADDAEAERVVHALSRRGYRVLTVIEHKRTKRLATARLQHDELPGIFVDLLFASSGIEREVVAHAERFAGGLAVARTGHLIALKLLSENEERLQDRIDLRALKVAASEADWKLAEEAVRTIRARGFHRGRALRTRLRRFRGA